MWICVIRLLIWYGSDLLRWILYIEIRKYNQLFVIKSLLDFRLRWYCSYYIFLYNIRVIRYYHSLYSIYWFSSHLPVSSHLIFSLYRNEQHYHQTKSNLTHDNTTNVDNFVTRELYKRDRKRTWWRRTTNAH